jgi:TldD protein
MQNLIEITDYLKEKGARFADAREHLVRDRTLTTENMRISGLKEKETSGTGIRVLYENGWGYSSTKDNSIDGLKKAADEALELAKAADSIASETVEYAYEPVHLDRFVTKIQIDPFQVDPSEQASLLLQASRKMLKARDIFKTIGYVYFKRQNRKYASTDGSQIETVLYSVLPLMMAVAKANGDVKSRTWMPNACNAGYEYFRELPFEKNAERIAAQAREHCFARPCSEGKTNLILDPLNLSLTMHESVGHPTELDRVLGYEESCAGRSFATLEKLKNFRYGSDLVTFIADNTMEGGLASYGYDDEGVKCQKWKMIDEGILVDYSTPRELAARTGRERANGTTRAELYNNVPITRIPNLYMAPGEKILSKEQIIADTKDGIYIEGRGTFSIDQMRLNMQFGGDAFWKIKNGHITGMLKNVVYNAISYEFWRSCDVVADAREFEKAGFISCGKGDPMQIGQMTHGASPARFRNIMVRRAK